MALSARGLDVASGKQRLFPGQRAAVGFFDGSRNSLAAVAHHAAELVDVMGNNGMFAEWLHADVGQTGFFQSDVASGAAVHDTEFRMPYLLDAPLKMALQGDGFTSAANHAQVGFLIMPPFTEVMLSRRDGERQQQDHADGTEYVYWIAEQLLPTRWRIVAWSLH